MVPGGPKRKHNDSHHTDLLLETSKLTVGPTDLMQHAAVSSSISQGPGVRVCLKIVAEVLKPSALAIFYPVSIHESYLYCTGMCVDSPLVSSQCMGRNQSRYKEQTPMCANGRCGFWPPNCVDQMLIK